MVARTERRAEERLVNLMVCLESSSTPRTFAQLRHDTRAYVQSDDESARRMFERDKDALRGMGVPIETVETPEGVGYRIDRAAWSGGDIDLDRDEVTALALGIALAGGQRERRALSRLTARAPDPHAEPAPLASMRLDVVDDGLDHVADAVAHHRTVSFDYRRADGVEQARTVEAWGLTLRNGVAYLIGWDHDRAARRTFRLSRVTSRIRTVDVDATAPVPPEFDAAEVLAQAHGDGTDVVVAMRAAAVAELEQRGGRVVADDDVDRELPDGWRAGLLAQADATRLRGWLLGSADRVVVREPAWLRAEVMAELRAMAETGGAP